MIVVREYEFFLYRYIYDNRATLDFNLCYLYFVMLVEAFTTIYILHMMHENDGEVWLKNPYWTNMNLLYWYGMKCSKINLNSVIQFYTSYSHHKQIFTQQYFIQTCPLYDIIIISSPHFVKQHWLFFLCA